MDKEGTLLLLVNMGDCVWPCVVAPDDLSDDSEQTAERLGESVQGQDRCPVRHTHNLQKIGRSSKDLMDESRIIHNSTSQSALRSAAISQPKRCPPPTRSSTSHMTARWLRNYLKVPMPQCQNLLGSCFLIWNASLLHCTPAPMNRARSRW